jgi:predicted PurR-regulated permease PerM
MRTRIDIETQTFVRFWLVVIAFVAVGFAIYSAMSALIILGTAFFLALVLNKPVSAIARWLPGNSRVGGTAIAYLLVLLFLGAFIFFVTPPIVQQTAKVAGQVPSFIEASQHQWEGLEHFAQQYGLDGHIAQAIESAKSSAADWATNFATTIGSGIVSSVGSLFGLVTAAFLTIVLTFLMLVEAPRTLKFLWSTYSDKDKMEHHRKLAIKMYHAVTGYVTGALTVAGLGGFFAGVTVFILSWIFGFEASLALPAAAITFVLSLIPMFGATIAGTIICLLLAMNNLTAAIIFAIYFIVYQQIENNFISPTVQSRTVKLSALAILASVTVGLYLFGIAGGIISIPIAGCVKVLVDDYLERKNLGQKPSVKLAKNEA